MDYKKSTIFDKRANSSKKLFQYKFANNNVNGDKRRSNEINPKIFSSRFKELHNSKINKAPLNHRLSLQNLNIFRFSKISKSPNSKNHKDNTIKKDKNYYLNILNEIYLNDSHLSNANKIIKFEKENPNKFARYRSSKNISFKFTTKGSNKKYSLFSNEYRNKSHKKLNIFNNIQTNTKEDKSNSKITGNFSHEIKNKKFNRKYVSTKTVSKFKTSKDKSIKKNKNSFNDNERKENLNDTLKDEKNNEMINKEIKTKKKICKLNNKNKKNDHKSNEKEETDMDAFDSNKNISNKKTDTKLKNVKFRKCWFFCCLTGNDKDDSYSDDI